MLSGRLAAVATAAMRTAHALLAPALVAMMEASARRAAAAAAAPVHSPPAAGYPLAVELAGAGAPVGTDGGGAAAEWLGEWRRRRATDDAVDDGDGDDGGGVRAARGDDGVWLMAVPKRKPSYRKKRLRQMNPLYRNEDLQVRAGAAATERGRTMRVIRVRVSPWRRGRKRAERARHRLAAQRCAVAWCGGGGGGAARERAGVLPRVPRMPFSLQSFYPCPKCDKGLLKLRHHLCPCDQQAVNLPNVVKVQYPRAAPAASGGESGAASAAAAKAAAPGGTAKPAAGGSGGGGEA